METETECFWDKSEDEFVNFLFPNNFLFGDLGLTADIVMDELRAISDRASNT